MNTQQWEWFKLSDERLFVIKKGKRLTKADMIDGNIRYVGAIDGNNGITQLISNDEHIHPANTITVSYNGSVAEAYYQNQKFWATDDVNVLYPQFPLNKYIAHFITTIIKKEKYRYNYGRKWDKELMKNSQIKLPVDSDGNPDWNYMEDYIKKIILKLPQNARKVWNNTYDISPKDRNIISLTDRSWKSKKIIDLFDEPYKATAYNAINLQPCMNFEQNSIPYITRTEENNGCKFYIKMPNESMDVESGNAITIGDTTATINYQNEDFICGDHIVVLRSQYLNKYNALFIISLLNKERFRYNYGRAFNKDIIANTVLNLPMIPNSDNPDWQFMEDYIKSLPYSMNI